ncbi:protein of unknown function [Methylorubrum extorquens]|uniref:Uncharacterized protein n=1 Tax=Methylorubrum extorquens TaxID=408 RepID=A0A2N9AH47_METEX|nr:protein of unknown function [Methylorubrum extorquens]
MIKQAMNYGSVSWQLYKQLDVASPIRQKPGWKRSTNSPLRFERQVTCDLYFHTVYEIRIERADRRGNVMGGEELDRAGESRVLLALEACTDLHRSCFCPRD